jgi:uncharacterized membrane protein
MKIAPSALRAAAGRVCARPRPVRGHRRIMIFIFSGALVVAGLFTFIPGRIMHSVVFGP